MSDAKGPDNNTGSGAPNLRTTVRDELPTPRATRGGSATETVYLLESDGESRKPLLPTPVVSDSESARRGTTTAGAMHSGASLGDVVDDLLPTPTRWEQRGDASTDDRNLLPLEAQRITSASGVGDLLPTPRETDGPKGAAGVHARSAERLEEGRATLPEAVSLLPTPTGAEAGNVRRGGSRGDELLLAGVAEEVSLLPTPTTQESHSGPSQAGRNTRPLNDQVLDFLPTPIVSDANGAPADAATRGAMQQLRDVEVPGALLPTPDVSSSRRSSESHESGEHQTSLHDIPHFLPTPVAMEGVKGTSLPPEHRIAGGHQVWLSNVAPTFVTELGEIDENDDLLPTPTARDHKDSSGMTPHPEKRKLAHTIAGELLPTPNAGQVGYETDVAEFDRRRAEAAARHGNNGLGEPLGVAVRRGTVNWGKYAPAIARGEEISGRPAPAPTLPDGRDGKHRLSSRFVEWMMLLEEGRVTGHGLSRAKELARLGNGVVPLQAAAAVATLIGRLADDKRSEAP